MVYYSFFGVKVYLKLVLVCCLEGIEVKLYIYLFIGNFYEDIVKVYVDFGLFMVDICIVNEVVCVFFYLEIVKLFEQKFEYLLVGQFNLWQDLEEMINFEICQVKVGKEVWMILKMNSLQDICMIKKLYEVSQVGVKVQMIIRGICCLVFGKKGWSENIYVVSIVDCYLEYVWVFVFYYVGEDCMYLFLVDWMVCNFSYWVEMVFLIYDENIKVEIMELLQLQLVDNVKVCVLDEFLSNIYYQLGNDLVICFQVEIYYSVKR